MPERTHFYQNAEVGMMVSLYTDGGSEFGDRGYINMIVVQGFPRQSWQSLWEAVLNVPDDETAKLLFDTLVQVSKVNQDHPRNIVAIWQKYITDSTNMEVVLKKYKGE